MKLDGRVLTIDQIKGHLASLTFSGSFKPKFIEIHNTSVPDIALFNKWLAAGKPTFEQWLKNLASYYSGLGWSSMPHAFVAPDGRIGLGAPFNVRGTHSPSWNSIAIGIETVGEFERETFDGTLSQKALVALVGELYLRLGLMPDQYVKGVRGIHFHREDLKSSHRTCPGRLLIKDRLIYDVLEYMGKSPDDVDHGHAEVPVGAQTADSDTLPPGALTSTVWLQERLNQYGAKLVVDGIIGPMTRAAVKAFQTKSGLVVDGIAGPITRLALNKG